MKLALLHLLVSALLWAESLTQQQTHQDSTRMFWQQAADPLALCNDFTRAGFFLRRNESSAKWVIFLESGSLCFSNDTCNRRFFRQEFRDSAPQSTSARTADLGASPFGSFSPKELLRTLTSSNTPPTDFINPLMTSMQCVDFPRGVISVEGRDILNPDPSKNDFFGHNHVLIPYCSSDLWLADEIREEDASRSCSCGDLACFNYAPEAERLQFAFRGRRIFRSVFEQLMTEHGMSGAREIILGGSSAGGVGVFNHAQWVRAKMPEDAMLFLILDSSWFINFQNNIFRIYSDVSPSENSTPTSQENSLRLLNIISDLPSCANDAMGFPCCISAHCVLTTRNRTTGNLLYFPSTGTRTFVWTSVYDSFLLAPAVSGLDNFEGVSSGVDQSDNVTALLIDFMRVVGEYGGEMNFTLSQAFLNSPDVSYYVTQCFQHIYFATSTLWGEGSVFGTDPIDLGIQLLSFSHFVESGRWDLNLSTTPTGTTLSARSAIHSWYTSSNSGGVRFLDACQGPYCNDLCPDVLELGELTSNNWPLWARIVIICCVVGLGVLCVVMKIVFVVWLCWLERRLGVYLRSLDDNLESFEAELEFPECPDSDKVAVSCLDLSYTVTVKKKKEKDESQDRIKAVVLQELDDSHEEETYSYSPKSSTRKSVLSRIGTLVKRKSSKSFDVGLSLESPSPPPVSPSPSNLTLTKSESMDEMEYTSCGCSQNRRRILKDISVYFNPGEMVGIMGPSGSGKTTLLDMLTGRRKTGDIEGDIYVNGIPMNEIRDWYIPNTGYVLQLAKPFYEQLTVRENLMLTAAIKLPRTKTFTWRDKFKRVVQVMKITGLIELADTVVGGETGPGLSGGQKRRLSVALQLLKLPSVLFLDEPTSGLDATSSMELLSHLNKLTDTQRTLILTIHQPRFEIFHMFHKLVLISEGKVAYHGVPEKAFEVFATALRDNYLANGLVIPTLEEHNPADVIMDMLGNPTFRSILTEYYQQSLEPKLVEHAIKLARWKEYDKSASSLNSMGSMFSFAIFGAKKVGQRHAHTYTRMAALEARAAKRILFHQVSFLPLMFLVSAFVLGTLYFQASRGFLVVSGMCIFSMSSGLFVFPTIELYFTPALRVYGYEKADGVGRSQDLVFQGFIRYIAVGFVPVIAATTLLYLLLIDIAFYDVLIYLQVVVMNVALNMTWTALYIALMLAFPKVAFRLSSLIASIFGVTSGFFIPIKDIPLWYRWLAFINPNYYGLSSVAFFLLEDFNPECQGSRFACFFSSGTLTLKQFSFQDVNPYLHLLILFVFAVFYLLLATVIQWLRYTSLGYKIQRLVGIIIKKPSDELSREISKDRDGYKRSITAAVSLDSVEDFSIDDLEFEGHESSHADEELPPSERVTTSLHPIAEEEGEEEEGPPSKKPLLHRPSLEKESDESEAAASSISNTEDVLAQNGQKKLTKISLNDSEGNTSVKKLNRNESLKTPYLSDGAFHVVWRPKKRPELADLVLQHQRQYTTRGYASGHRERDSNGSPLPQGSTSAANEASPRPRTSTLLSRQKSLLNRAEAAQAVLKEHTEELLSKNNPEEGVEPVALTTRKLRARASLLTSSKRVTEKLKKRKSPDEKKPTKFSGIVSQYLANLKAAGNGTETSQTGSGSVWDPHHHQLTSESRSKEPLQRSLTSMAIPLKELRKIVVAKSDLSRCHSDGAVGVQMQDSSLSTTPRSKMEASLWTAQVHLPAFDTQVDEGVEPGKEATPTNDAIIFEAEEETAVAKISF